jgi:hypothetical protein
MRKICTRFADALGTSALVLLFTSVGAQTIQTFNTTSTWSCPSGVSKVTVECWGAGGGGGNSDSAFVDGGCGGGGGAFSKSILPVTSSTNYQVNVGAGGTGAPSSSTIAATSGGGSWFNTPTTILARGGAAGANNSVNGGGNGASALAGIGTLRWSGGRGADASGTGGGGGGSSAGNSADGNYTSSVQTQVGASAPSGGGNGGNASPLNAINGAPGIVPGGGGGGSENNPLSAGGNGADGKIVISYSTIISFSPTYACVGSTPVVTITGTGFIGVTSVTFNSLPASFTVISSTQITATVPAAMTTGPIEITTAYGVCYSIGFLIVPLTPVSVNITAVPPSPSTGTGPFTVCNGTTYYFMATVTNGGSAPTYQWWDGTAQIGTNSSTLTYNVNGTSTVYCVVTYGGTGVICPDNIPATSNTITFNPVPPPTQPTLPVGLSTVCITQTGVIYTTSATGASNYTWTAPGGIIISGQGTGTITVNWGSIPGTYTISVIPYNICGVAGPIRTMTITVLPLSVAPSVSVSDAAGGPTLICVNDCINFSATMTDPSNIVKTIVWKVDGTPTFTATSTTTASFVYPNSGSFSYCFQTPGAHSISCEITFAGQPSPGQCYSPNISISNTIVYTVNICSGISQIVSPSSLRVFPNPSDDVVNLEWENNSITESNVFISDILGNMISEFRTEINYLSIDASSLRSGVYLITVKSSEKIFRSQLVIY